jgi:serine protease
MNINRTNGFTGAVTFSVSPAGGTFSPNPATGTSSTLTFLVDTNTPPGTYGFTVTGTSGSVTRTTTGTLIVQ